MLVSRFVILAFAVVSAVAGCSSGSPNAETPRTPESDPEGYKLFLKDKTVAALKERLRDPESAQFTDIHYGTISSEGRSAVVVCGRVNSKNGFGGMTGSQRFIGLSSAVFLEEEGASAVNEAWRSAGC